MAFRPLNYVGVQNVSICKAVQELFWTTTEKPQSNLVFEKTPTRSGDTLAALRG